jgi:hypothetical protein
LSSRFQTVIAKSGLPRGDHTLAATKRGGAVMSVDAFQVSELIIDAIRVYKAEAADTPDQAR